MLAFYTQVDTLKAGRFEVEVAVVVVVVVVIVVVVQ